MNKQLYIGKLLAIKPKVVPSLFTERQFEVLLKRLRGEKLTQVEKNYLSNAIKEKIEAIDALKTLNLENARDSSEKDRQAILASYARAGIVYHGAKSGGRHLTPTETVERVLENYEQLDSRIVNALPVYIVKELQKIDLIEIDNFSRDNSIINFTGYVFSLALHFIRAHKLAGERKIINFLKRWAETKDPFTVASKPYLLAAKEFIAVDELAKSWNILTLNKLESYEKYFELYGAA